MVRPNIQSRKKYNKKTHKKCIKCRQWKPRFDIDGDTSLSLLPEKKAFGNHDSADGLQSICYSCKNVANNKARDKNVSARIRHHTATRCLTQLGESAPPQFVANLEEHLGYRISALVKHLSKDLKDREGAKRKLRDALQEGYHIDHIKPLSSYPVVMDGMDQNGNPFVDWTVFRECWAISNLTAIPASENLAKGAKYEEPSETQAQPEEEAQEEDVSVDTLPESNPGGISWDCDCAQDATEACVNVVCPRK